MHKGARTNMPSKMRYALWGLLALCAIAAVVLRFSGLADAPATASPQSFSINQTGKTVSITYKDVITEDRYEEEIVPLIEKAQKQCPAGVEAALPLISYRDEVTFITLICKPS